LLVGNPVGEINPPALIEAESSNSAHLAADLVRIRLSGLQRD
jgi:hypothetical protein